MVLTSLNAEVTFENGTKGDIEMLLTMQHPICNM